ncbi:MAG: hypothetical protein R2772_11250 [Chitinophagales bacterium]
MKILKALIINIVLSSIASSMVIFLAYFLCLDLLPADSDFVPFLLCIVVFFILGFCHLLFFLPLYLFKGQNSGTSSAKEFFREHFSVLLLPLALYLFIGYQARYGIGFSSASFQLFAVSGLTLMLIHSLSLYTFLDRLIEGESKYTEG